MRCLVKVSMPTEGANPAFKKGVFGRTMEGILTDLRPESAYFTTENGHRTGYMVMDVKEPGQMVQIAEPFYLAFNAKVDFHPAMTPQELAKAGPHIEQAVKKYGNI